MNLLLSILKTNDGKTSQYNIKRISKISNPFYYYYKVFDPTGYMIQTIKNWVQNLCQICSHPTDTIQSVRTIRIISNIDEWILI